MKEINTNKKDDDGVDYIIAYNQVIQLFHTKQALIQCGGLCYENGQPLRFLQKFKSKTKSKPTYVLYSNGKKLHKCKLCDGKYK